MERLDASEALIRIFQFENCTLPLNQWTHRMHLITGLYVYLTFGSQSLKVMREWIWRYNEQVGQGNDEKGYHETLTFFWLWLIRKFCIEENITQFDDAALIALYSYDPFMQKRIVEEYFHVTTLYSPYARRNIAIPDEQDMEDMEYFEE